VPRSVLLRLTDVRDAIAGIDELVAGADYLTMRQRDNEMPGARRLSTSLAG